LSDFTFGDASLPEFIRCQYAFTTEQGRTLKEFTLALNADWTIVVDLR
jgi:hypothetical protein